MRVGGGSWIWRQGDPLTTWIAFFGSMIKIRTITSSFYMDIHLFIKFFRVWREVYLAFHKWSSFSLQTMSPGPGAKQELTELCPVVEICSVLSLRDMGQSGESEMWLLGHSGWYCEAGIKESQSFCLTLGMALHEATTANNLCPLPTLIFFFLLWWQLFPRHLPGKTSNKKAKWRSRSVFWSTSTCILLSRTEPIKLNDC